MKVKGYDFSGYATRNDIKCSDGRTIRKNAFIDNDGDQVPIVWMHGHNDIENVLGHGILENRDDGVFMYGFLNDTPKGKAAKETLKHKDITGLSIFATDLVEKAGNVMHGVIKEVSLVLSPANVGAYIEDVVIHGEDAGTAAIIYGLSDKPESALYHSDDLDDDDPEDDEDLEDEEFEDEAEEETDEEEQKRMWKKVESWHIRKNTDTDDEDDGDTIGEILDSLNEKQKMAFYACLAAVKKGEVKHSEEGEEDMKHNVFEQGNEPARTLSHADKVKILNDAKKLGSFKEAIKANLKEGGVLAHAWNSEVGVEMPEDLSPGYGLAGLEYLFPEAKYLDNEPQMIQRDQEWVGVIMNGVHKTPYSRVKSLFANITMEEARARGYMKGNLKKEEVFSLLRRSTDAQTIYKKQKLDRDDITDLNKNFDIVRYLWKEMRVMLNEEIARAILIGDGRLSTEEDKIFSDHIRPIVSDSPLFTVLVNVSTSQDEEIFAKNFIKAVIKGRKAYKGSGRPILFTTEDFLTNMLLLEDGVGRMLYADEAQLATKLRVSKIVTVPFLDNFTLEGGSPVYGIIVNPADYNVGTDHGGEITTFEDFDIDYNQYKYLIETRCSGALTKPFSALVLTSGATVGGNPAPNGWNNYDTVIAGITPESLQSGTTQQEPEG